MGAFLVDLFQADQPGKGKQELQEELTALRTGSNETVRSYYIRKFSTVLMVLTIGVVLSIVCFFAYAGKTSDVEDQTLMRPGYGEGNRQEELAVEVDPSASAQAIARIPGGNYYSRAPADREKCPHLIFYIRRPIQRKAPGGKTKRRTAGSSPDYNSPGSGTRRRKTAPPDNPSEA